MARKDLTGQVFGRLTVLEVAYRKKKHTFWKCQCSCGKTCNVRTDKLLQKKKPTRSCGCIRNEILVENNKATRFKPTHGDSDTRFYHIYRGMLDRCNNPNMDNYKYYGGIGIKCLWECYEDFKADMHESYIEHVNQYGESDTEIDRIDCDGNYCKDNCHWVTNQEQANNKHNTVYVIMDNNVLIPLADFVRDINNRYNTNITYSALLKRYYRSMYNGTKKIPCHSLVSKKELGLD